MDSELIGVATKGRFFAMAVDNLIAMFISLLLASNMPEEVGQARWALVVGVYLAYYFVQEGTWSTTFGKRLFGLRVARLDGSECGWPAAAIRTVARIIEVNPILLGALPGGLAVALSKRHQRMGDMLSKTVVVLRSQRAVQQMDEADKARAV
jgi:uncharacterized RDD family membrane protein YckC